MNHVLIRHVILANEVTLHNHLMLTLLFMAAGTLRDVNKLNDRSLCFS